MTTQAPNEKRRAILSPPSRKSFARINLIHTLIKAKRYPNVPLLSKRMEVSARTVERDLQALRDFFEAPLAFNRFKNGFYYEHSFDLPKMKLTEGEAVALILSQHLLSQYKGAPFGKTLEAAIDKIADLLPDTVTMDCQELFSEISFDVQAPRGEEQHIAAAYHFIAERISQRESVNITYYTAGRDVVSTRCIDPYHLRYHQGAWYLIAYCHVRGQVRVFALDRIRSWEDTGKIFTCPSDFNMEEFLQHSFGIEIGTVPTEIVVRFDAYQARFMREKVWHPSQETEDLPDGSMVIRMTVSGLGEVKRWVLSYGSHAEVLFPESLRHEIAEEAAALLEKY